VLHLRYGGFVLPRWCVGCCVFTQSKTHIFRQSYPDSGHYYIAWLWLFSLWRS